MAETDIYIVPPIIRRFSLLQARSRYYPPRHQSGFNIIESAIVLAVIALIVATVWTAASSMRTYFILNRTTSGIVQMAGGVFSTFSINDFYPSTGTCQSKTISSAAKSAGLIPGDWKRHPTNSSYYLIPSGGTLLINLKTDCSSPYQGVYDLEFYIFGASADSLNAYIKALIPVAARNAGRVGLSCAGWTYSPSSRPIPNCTASDGRITFRF